MEEDNEREQRRSYTLEEILSLTEKDSSNIFPADGARDWIENSTRFKLREAKYFFSQVEKTYKDFLENDTDRNRDIFLFNLGAFFSAARSITYYMQIQYAEKDQFWEWYCPQQRKMKEDREMRFLKDLRVNSIHFQPPIVTMKKGQSYLLDANILLEEKPLYGTQLPESIPIDFKLPKRKAMNAIFKAGQTIGKKSLSEDTEVIPFCLKQLNKLELLVNECEKLFNKVPRNPCDEIHSDISQIEPDLE